MTTRYLVDDLNPTGYAQVVEEVSSTGAVQREYTYGLQRSSQHQLIGGTWTPSFYGYDGFGSVRQLTLLQFAHRKIPVARFGVRHSSRSEIAA